MISFKSSIAALLVIAASLMTFTVRADEKLEEAMDAMNKPYKALKAQVSDASKNASSLELVSEMQKQTLIAKSGIPVRAAKESDKAKFTANYRVAMIKLMEELLKLETALVEGKNDQAAAIYANLAKIKSDGHEKFQEE